jgi:hypothetical protein
MEGMNDEFVTWYEHDGVVVATKAHLKNKHFDYTLCSSCKSFKPSSPDNCNIVKAVYKNCIAYNILTPIFECPNFEEII